MTDVELQKIGVKVFVQEPRAAGAADGTVKLTEFVPVFQQWIQNNAIPDHLLIDVADYSHVQDGPGMVLVAHEANFVMDLAAGRLGLYYYRKRAAGTSFADGLRQALQSALHAAVLLERDDTLCGRLVFRSDELRIVANDRLLSPNTEATFAALAPQITAVLGPVYGSEPALVRDTDPKSLFAVQVTAPATAGIAELLERLET